MASMCRRVSVLSKAATGLSNRQIFSVTRPNQLYTNVQHIDGVKFSTTSQNCLKEINVKKEEGVIQIEGKYIEDPNKDKILHLDSPHPKICPLCPNKLKMEIKYTDVLILSQFLRSDGCLLPRRATGLCAKAQTKLGKLVHKAQRAGLMPEYRPDQPDGRPHYDLKSPYKWKKYNAYFED